jgi:D-serine deaminase-like pyridoxal phosphate-dependent protein
VVIEVDVGMGRCGCQPGEPVVELAGAVTRLAGLRFRGLMGYEGHAVGIADAFERGVVCRTSLSLLTSTADLLRARGLPVEIVSAGGTGTHDVAGRYPGITEIQAGSYALMDLQYRGIAPQFACALNILSTVISRPTRDRAVTDSGLKSMTTEFGLPVVVDRPGVVLRDLSEEHGILEVEPGAALGPGETLALFPTHSCTTVSLHPYLYLVRDGIVREVWAVDGGRGRGHRAL